MNPELNTYLSKSVKYLCGASGRITLLGCQSKFWDVVFGAPFCCGLWSVLATRLWVGRLAGWLASGTLPYMWRALQFAEKMRRDKEQKHFLAVQAESGDELVCRTVSSRCRGQRRWCWQWYVSPLVVIKWEEGCLTAAWSLFVYSTKRHKHTHARADSYRLELPVYPK